MLSVIMPMLNEAELLAGNALDEIALSLDREVGPGRWLFVPIDNGSTDATPQGLERLRRRWPTRELRLEQRNIGRAMLTGLRSAESEWAYLLPVDEFDPEFLVWAWRHRHDYDMIMGSKRADPTLNEQSAYRRLLSWGLNCVLQLTCGSVMADTHGQKLLNLAALGPVAEDCAVMRGLFDSELALRAWRRGLRLAEVPVPYRERRPSRDPMLRKIGRNVVDVVRLWRHISRLPFTASPCYRRFSRSDVLAG